MEESKRILIGLNIAAVISETNNQDLLDSMNLEIERANKKKKKLRRHWQKKINLA